MDFQTIKAHFEWFTAEATSWNDLGEDCRELTAQLSCIAVQRDEPLFTEVYDAYVEIRSSFITSTDGLTGVGYGVAAQMCDRVHDALLSVAADYARAEAENAADLARVEKLIKG